MYNQKLSVAIKSNGKVLREFKDTVYMPFGNEYQISIKNLNTVRALVNIYLDGTDVAPGGLVVNAGQTIDLERWIKNGNLTEGNRFKFIERTAQIEKHKGIGHEDGLVRVEYQFEKPAPVYSQLTTSWDYSKQIWDTHPNIARGFGYNISSASDVPTKGVSKGIFASAQACSASYSAPVNDVGITVPGSKSTQSFSTTTIGALETEKHSIILKLLGETADNKPVLKEVTVKHKPVCVTCGKHNKAHAKYCVECGTALEIFA